MSLHDTSKRIFTLGLLLILVWGRVWAGMPQSMPHPQDEIDDNLNVVDVCGHNLTVSDHLLQHQRHAGAEPQTTATVDADDGDEHHHHVHLCSLAGSALTSNIRWNLSVSKPVLRASQTLMAVVRRHQPLLRPPQG